jgi:predicted phage terminase large subunit-like protein
VKTSTLTPEQLRQERLRLEREYYLSDEGFLDFVRDSGAAPDAQLQPHGRYAQEIITWRGEPDPESKGRIIYKWKLVLWPRGSFKSQVFNVGHVCWLIAKDPNRRILVASETSKQAKDFVEKAKEIIDSEWYRERFGVHRGIDWRQGRFTSALRTRKEIKEPTLQATGVGEVRTGMHWDDVFMDDVCSQENTRTPEAIENLWNWFGETLAQLDPGCRLFVIGTLHHYADIYCRIQKEPEIKKLFDISIHSWREKDGALFFPGRITERFIAQQKAIMPPRLFACFYENRPTTGEDQLFKPEYFRVILDRDVPDNVWTYILTDFAFIAEEKKKGRADRCAFWVVSIDCNRDAYVRDFYVGRWKPSDSVRIVCDLWDRYQYLNLKAVGLEDTAHKELLSTLFDEVRRQTFTRPKLVPVTGRSQEVKDRRIEAIEPRFRAGNIYFVQSLRDNMRKWKPLVDEMVEWPYSQHDDIPDAISDLDKRDANGKLFFPHPAPGWRSSAARPRHQPVTIDGKWNEDRAYPARDSVRRDQQGGDFWREAGRNQSSQVSKHLRSPDSRKTS